MVIIIINITLYLQEVRVTKVVTRTVELEADRNKGFYAIHVYTFMFSSLLR